jgi:hypothetical protein
MRHVFSGMIMKNICLFALTLAASAALAFPQPSHAQEGVDKAKAQNFDAKMFARPFDEKTYACFVRRYDANHLAQHPKQNVSAMKLLVTAEIPSDAKDTVNYSFRVGFQFRHRPVKFDSAGACRHIVAEDNGDEVRLRCGVDCDGGGIEVAMKDDKSAVVRTERIRIWKHKHPDDEDTDDARLGDDDKAFHLDRVDTRECADLADDRKEVAALRHK